VIVLPVFKAWTEVFPSCAPLLEQAEANLAYYAAEVQQRRSNTGEIGNGMRKTSSSTIQSMRSSMSATGNLIGKRFNMKLSNS